MGRSSFTNWWHRTRNWFVARLRVGTPHAVVALAGLAVAVAVVGAIAIQVLHVAKSGHQVSGFEALWESMIRTLDPGQLDLGQLAGGSGGGRAPWGFALVAFGLTVCGLLLVSSLISLINNTVERAIERAGRGRARAPFRPKRADRPFIVILGWSELAPRLLRELAAAGHPDRAPDVLVMAPVDIATMEQRVAELREEVRHEIKIKPHWPEFRTGSPFDRRDLNDRAGIAAATTVIVLADDTVESRSEEDHMSPATADVVRSVFAVASAVEEQRNSDGLSNVVTIVAEVPPTGTGPTDLAATLSRRFGSAEQSVNVIAVNSASVQAGIAAQVARRPGLARVYADLLDFTGHEFRIVPSPGSMRFGDAVQDCADASVIGICKDDGSNGVDLWPDWASEITGRDRLVVVSNGAGRPTTAASPPSVDRLRYQTRPERPVTGRISDGDVTIVGWNVNGREFVASLDRYLSPTSRIRVVSNDERCVGLRRRYATAGCERIEQIVPPGGVHRWLDSPSAHRSVQHVVLLSDESVPARVADAEVLLALQALHPAGDDGNPSTIVAELRHRSSSHLPAHHAGFDVIVGDALVSLLLAQYAMNHEIHQVIDSLVGDDGNEIDLVPCPDLAPDATFADVVAQCGASGQIAIGVRSRPTHIGRQPKLLLNPRKSLPMSGLDVQDVVVLTRPPAAVPST